MSNALLPFFLPCAILLFKSTSGMLCAACFEAACFDSAGMHDAVPCSSVFMQGAGGDVLKRQKEVIN